MHLLVQEQRQHAGRQRAGSAAPRLQHRQARHLPESARRFLHPCTRIVSCRLTNKTLSKAQTRIRVEPPLSAQRVLFLFPWKCAECFLQGVWQKVAHLHAVLVAVKGEALHLQRVVPAADA